jgi:hypothetical protein
MKTLAEPLDVVLVQFALPAEHFRHDATGTKDIDQVFLFQTMLFIRNRTTSSGFAGVMA